MTKQTHTIILSTQKLDLPENPNVIELINQLIHNNLCNIEYFGDELDNQADYLDEEMTIKMESTTYINIHFDEIITINVDYNASEENVLNLILTLINEKQIRDVSNDGKDFDIYIY